MKTPDEKKSNPSISYVELDGPIHCSSCTFLDGEFCNNPRMLVKVNAQKGCCNLWDNDEAKMWAKKGK